MQMDQEQKKKLLTALALIISLPVLVVGVWAAVITILVSKGSMLGMILIIGPAETRQTRLFQGFAGFYFSDGFLQ